MKRFFLSLLFSVLPLALPMVSRAEEAHAAADTAFHIDGGAFVDSLQYMLKGMVGIFLVTGLIILVLVILEKATKGKRE